MPKWGSVSIAWDSDYCLSIGAHGQRAHVFHVCISNFGFCTFDNNHPTSLILGLFFRLVKNLSYLHILATMLYIFPWSLRLKEYYFTQTSPWYPFHESFLYCKQTTLQRSHFPLRPLHIDKPSNQILNRHPIPHGTPLWRDRCL